MQPGSELHLPLTIDSVAVRVEIRTVVLHKIQRPRRPTRTDGVGAVRDAGDVLVVHQIERFSKKLEPKSVKVSARKVKILADTKIDDRRFRHINLVAAQNVDAVGA